MYGYRLLAVAAALLCGAAAGIDRTSLRLLVEAAVAELVEYYESDETLLEEFVRSGSVEGRRLARAALKEDVVVIAAIGSSVTAGHDAFGSTAWPAVLERRLRPVLKVEVRNQGVGGRTPFPASLCLRPIVGADVDVIVREWEYWTLNDGLGGLARRDVIKKSKADDLLGAKLLAATARTLPKRPTVYFMQMDADGESARTRQLVAEKNVIGDNVVVASAFGKAFDHLRDKAPRDRVPRREGHRRCSSRHVGECPLSPPDGYHLSPKWDGFGEDVRDDVRQLANPARLFINWHPGSLGHEVMGNQVAYHVLKSILRGLDEIDDEDESTMTDENAKTSASCDARICKLNISCAMTTRPVASGPSVGDLVSDRSTTLWQDSPTDKGLERSRQCAKVPDCGQGSMHLAVRCYDWLRRCSYRDQRRGWKGSAQSGPLKLRIPHSFFEQSSSSASAPECVVYIFETGHEWAKPSTIANWHYEVKIDVDGEPCRACSVVQGPGDYIQGVRIDLRQHRRGGGGGVGGGCGGTSANADATAAAAEISLHVEPLESLADFEKQSGQSVCAVAKNGRCEPAKEWRRYDFRCIATGEIERNASMFSPRCMPGPRWIDHPRSDVDVFVDSVMTF